MQNPNKPDVAKGKERVRRCVVSGAEAAPETLLRFVRAPDGVLSPDLREKLPGRGAWVANSRSAVGAALTRKAFARSFRAQVTLPGGEANAEFLDRVEALLRDEALASLGLATRAGELVTGFEKVAEAAKKGRLAAIVSAVDASDDGVRKMKSSAAGAPLFRAFSVEQQSGAIGGVNAVHIGLLKGNSSRRVVQAVSRLFAYREELQD